MQTLSTLAFECDIDIAEDSVNEIVHARFLKLAPISWLARELCRTLNFRIQELAEKFEVEGIPFLCVVSKDGKETKLSDNGYEDVMLKKEKAIDEWRKLYN